MNAMRVVFALLLIVSLSSCAQDDGQQGAPLATGGALTASPSVAGAMPNPAVSTALPQPAGRPEDAGRPAAGLPAPTSAPPTAGAQGNGPLGPPPPATVPAPFEARTPHLEPTPARDLPVPGAGEGDHPVPPLPRLGSHFPPETGRYYVAGPDYAGSGMPDPEPLRKVPNDQMMAWATQPGHPDRLTALVSVARRHLPGALPAIRRALADESLLVQMIALSALIELGGPEALALQWAVAKDTTRDQELRGTALMGVSFWGRDQTLAALKYAFSQDNPVVIGDAILNTRRILDAPEIWPYLEKGLDHPHQRAWQEAAGVLSDIADRRAIELLQSRFSTATGDKRFALDFYLKKAWRNARPAWAEQGPR